MFDTILASLVAVFGDLSVSLEDDALTLGGSALSVIRDGDEFAVCVTTCRPSYRWDEQDDEDVDELHRGTDAGPLVDVLVAALCAERLDAFRQAQNDARLAEDLANEPDPGDMDGDAASALASVYGDDEFGSTEWADESGCDW